MNFSSFAKSGVVALSLLTSSAFQTWADSPSFAPVKPETVSPAKQKLDKVFKNSRLKKQTTRRAFPGATKKAVPTQAATRNGSSLKTREIWGSYPISYNEGIYSYDILSNQFSPLAIDSDLFANGGGVSDGTYYYSITAEDFFGWIFVYGYIYDMNTWERTYSAYSMSDSDLAYDLAYDPTTGKVYGSYIGGEYGSGPFWGEMNTSTLKASSIKVLDDPYIAVACNAEGQYYGITSSGILYKIDKTTGASTEVGSTDVATTEMPQSATFDLKYGTMFWSAENADGTFSLYTVDTETGRADLVNDFEDNYPLMGMYIPTPEAEFGAPSAAIDLVADFPEGATSGYVTFTVATLTYGGDDLSGNVTYTVLANDEQVATGIGAPGENISVPLTLNVGMTTFAVLLANEEGESPAITYSCFIGSDGPAAVKNISAIFENGIVTLSWDAPASSINGGYFNPETLTYRVVRIPDNQIIAETISAREITDEINTVELAVYQYQITAFNGDIQGETAISQGIISGEYCSVPYFEDFSNQTSMDLFTIINLSENTKTWGYQSGSYGTVTGNYAVIDYDFSAPKDDWLITPAIRLETDRVYRLKFKTVSKRVLPEILEVAYGRDNTVEGMTNILLEPTTITIEDSYDPDIYRDWEFEIPVNETGLYYIGFHACSEPQMSRLYVGDILVEEGANVGAPEAPTDLELVPGDMGALEVTVSVTVPSKSVNGENLNYIEKVEFYVNDNLSETINNPAPGSTVTCTLPTVQGDNEIMVKAYGVSGQGLEVKGTVYTGVVRPGLVSNVLLKYQDGKAYLTWDAPTSGVGGGYINPDELEYMVYSNMYDFLYVTETQYINDLSGYDLSDQNIISYTVFARSAAGLGDGVSSNAIVIGNGAYTLPFKESFPNGYTTHNVWGISSTTETSWWTTTYGLDCSSYDGDNGMAWFDPRGYEESSMIYSGHISLVGADKPVLSVYVYDNGQQNNKLEILATTNYADFIVLKTVEQGKDLEFGWNQVTADLSAYKNEPWVAIALKGISGATNYSSMYIDCLEVYDDLRYNLGLDEFDAPAAISFGTSSQFAGVITNYGKETALDFSVDIYADEEVVASQSFSSLRPGATETFSMIVTPVFDMAPSANFKAVINYPEDENLQNNSSDLRKILIIVPDFNTVTTLQGEYVGSNMVELSWQLPEPGQTVQATLESFEEYNPFIINNIGDWTLVDIDGEDGTLGISYGGNNIVVDNVLLPHAYQVYNPELAGLGSQIGLDAFLPHTGEQYLTSWQDTDGVCDDWLISPELSGDAQVITFYVKSPVPNYGFETFEVLYSTTGNSISDFIKIDGIKEEAFMSWEQVAAYLPEGTKYFAIRHTSVAKWVLAIDDIRFVAKGAEFEDLNITGFKIYRDDVLIGTVNGTETLTYIDTDVKAGESYTYAVTTVYEQGESGYSNRVFVDYSTGLIEMKAKQTVKAGKGYIDINGAMDAKVSVMSVDGKVVFNGKAVSDNERYNVSQGIYLVVVADKSYKVIVK